MERHAFLSALTLAALALVAGCSDDTVAPPAGGTADVSASELADVVLQTDLLTEQVVNEQLAAMSTVAPSTTGDGGGVSGTRTVTFSRSRACPGGGQMSMAGTLIRTFDADTGVMEAESSGTRTRDDCTFARGETTITVNAQSQWDSFRRRVDGVPDGLQTSHYYGSKHVVRSDGHERSCEFDVTVVRDPATHSRTLDGFVCGTEVHRTVTWSFDE